MPLVYNTGILHLPAELKSNVAGFCSRSTLASLALCHRSFTKEAERELYGSLALVSVGPRRILGSYKKCLQTLLDHPRKAYLVRSLYIECTRDGRSRKRRWTAMENILEVLKRLPSLYELNIRLHAENEEELEDALGELEALLCGDALPGVKVLYCDDYLDYTKIVQARKNLDILGVYDTGTFDGPTATVIKKLQEVKLMASPLTTLPTIFTLGEISFGRSMSQSLAIYPSFYHQTTTTPSYTSVIDSINSAVLSGHPCIDLNEIETIQIFMHDVMDGRALRAQVDAISELVNHRKIFTCEVYFSKESSTHLPPELEAVHILRRFPGLKELRLKIQ